MNHDCTHCLDWSSDCPSTCFRGELVRDLREGQYKFVGWAHFEGTEECKKEKFEKASV